MEHDSKIKDAADKLLLKLPDVTASQMFGFPAYKASGKSFAFVSAKGLVIKLPEARVSALVGEGKPFSKYEPKPGMVWKQWVSIGGLKANQYAEHEKLMRESMDYVRA